jgi:hypothetical protein
VGSAEYLSPGSGKGRAARERTAQPLDGELRLVVDLTPREVERAPPLVVELLVPRQLGASALTPLIVILHRTVRLGDRPVSVPAEVRPADEAMPSTDVHLQIRRRDPELSEPDPGDALQRRLRAPVGEIEHLARANDPGPLPALLKDDRELHLDHDVAVQHGVRGHDTRHKARCPRDVHDRPGDGRDRDAAGCGDVVIWQGRGPNERPVYQGPAGFFRPARQRDRRHVSPRGQQQVDAVQVRGGLMARHQAGIPFDHGSRGDGMQQARVIRQAFQPFGR